MYYIRLYMLYQLDIDPAAKNHANIYLLRFITYYLKNSFCIWKKFKYP